MALCLKEPRDHSPIRNDVAQVGGHRLTAQKNKEYSNAGFVYEIP